MRIQGATIREQGVTFAIIIVKPHVIDMRTRADETICSLQDAFSSMPIILMSQNYRGIPRYYGRHDIVNMLKNVPTQCIPWKEYDVRMAI
jgi:hypothetical protein